MARVFALAALGLALAAQPPAAEAQTGRNLVANGGFERSLGGWSARDARLVRVRGGRFGRRGARVSRRGRARAFSIRTIPAPLRSTRRGRTYAARAWVRARRRGRRVCLRIRERSRRGRTVGAARRCRRTTIGWRRFRALRYRTRGRGNRIELTIYQTGARRGDRIRVDGVSLRRLTAPVGPPPPPPPGTLVAAGDIAVCGSNGDEQTAALIDSIPGTVATLGDNAYDSGSPSEFANCYGPSWGRHKARTRPVAGNHEYQTSGAAGHFGYFGAAAGEPGKGWYSFDLGNWHVVALNSNCGSVGGCGTGSPQETWLRADLAARPAACTLAMWHHPRFSSGTEHGSSTATRALWQALYDANAELVLVGHEHHYERFAPQTANGMADPQRGIRQFTVGTGGRGHYGFGSPIANSEVRHTGTFGVMKLTLRSNSYDWQFVPVAGKTFTDTGSGPCH